MFVFIATFKIDPKKYCLKCSIRELYEFTCLCYEWAHKAVGSPLQTAEQGDLPSLRQTDRWPLEDVMLNLSCLRCYETLS